MADLFIDKNNKSVIYDGVEYFSEKEISLGFIERVKKIHSTYEKKKKYVTCVLLQDKEYFDKLFRNFIVDKFDDELINPQVYLWEDGGGLFVWLGSKKDPNAIISAEFLDDSGIFFDVEIN